MPTNIFKFDGTLLTVLQDNSLDTTSSVLELPGRDYSGYGAAVLGNIIWNMEHFAGPSAPITPMTGQNWYDYNLDFMKVYNGTSWDAANGTIVSPTKPLVGANPSALWYDSENLQLNVWNSNSWNLVGPFGSITNNDPVGNLAGLYPPDNSVIDAIQITDKKGISHQAFRITVGGIIVAIISKDDTYTPYPGISGFLTITPGINLNSLIVTNATDTTIFRSTQDNVPDSSGTRSLGSAKQQFANVFVVNSSFSNQLIVGNSSITTATFQVNGTSAVSGRTNLGNIATFSSGLASAPSIVFTPSTLVTSLIQGGIEFDGSNLYITGHTASGMVRNNIAIGDLEPPGSWGFIFSGTANAIVAACTPAPPQTLPLNTIITGVIPATNTSTAVTISVNGRSPVLILMPDGQTPPPIGSLIQSHIVQLSWNGTNWLAMTDLTANGSIGSNSSYLLLTGGTMTGAITLAADPTTPLQAVTKQYVDKNNAILQNEIDTLSSRITNVNLSNYMPLAGGTMTGPLILPGNPPSALSTAPKQYVDSAFANVSLANFLPLLGGTMTGPLTLKANPTSSLQAATKQYVDTAITGLGGAGAFLGIQVFTTSAYQNTQNYTTTYTPKSGATRALVIATGGGGGGGSATCGTSSIIKGGCGGGGATVIGVMSVSSSTSYGLTVGGGGYPSGLSGGTPPEPVFSGIYPPQHSQNSIQPSTTALVGGTSSVGSFNARGGGPGGDYYNAAIIGHGATGPGSGGAGGTGTGPAGSLVIPGSAGSSSVGTTGGGGTFWGKGCMDPQMYGYTAQNSYYSYINLLSQISAFTYGGGAAGTYISGGTANNGIFGIGGFGADGIVVILDFK